MNEQDTKRFNENFAWFNRFFSDLKQIFEIAFNAIPQKYLSEAPEAEFYHTTTKKRLTMPEFCAGGIEGKRWALQIYAIFDQNLFAKPNTFLEQPSIIVFLHSHPDKYGYFWGNAHKVVTQFKATEFPHRGNAGIKGRANINPEADFFAFQVLFDKLSSNDAVKEHIANPIIAFLEKDENQ
ncbi:MAG: hypothetical protein HZC40_13815 [Chloroflexi bacterium]|nr:hypothetical protein [Chloroflexota bacterium]